MVHYLETSSRGYKYIMIMYNQVSKAILVEALKIRGASDKPTATTKLQTIFKTEV